MFSKKNVSLDSFVAYLEYLVDYIGKLSPWIWSAKKLLREKKGDESSLAKFGSLLDLDFIEFDADNVVMICLLYFLELGLVGK